MEEQNKAPIEMGRFFDGVASSYDSHRTEITSYDLDALFAAVAGAIEETRREVRILDLGAGTGEELEGILARAPNARITCIDVSGGMLDELRRKYRASLGQIDIVRGSFLDMPLQSGHYDYAVSVQVMHHFTYGPKLEVYTRVRKALVPGGMYIEGDHVLPPDEAKERLAWYERQVETGVFPAGGLYHVDIPFSAVSQRRILTEAGFSSVEVLHEEEYAMVLAAW
jgi:tRNA (cmo5U34)-methyltransferase